MVRRPRRNQIITGIIAFVMIFMNCYVEQAFAAGNNGNNNKNNTEPVQGVIEDNGSNLNTDIIVKYKNVKKKNSTIAKVKSETDAEELTQKGYYKKQKIGIYEVDETDDLDAIIEELNNNPNVEYAQPNYPLETTAIPTDDRLEKQWAIYNDGQEVDGYTGRATVDINVLNAWNLTMGDSDVVVGVLDTGINTGHTDLKGNIYTNSDEVAGNGIDDDGNGYIDDLHGWDFSNDDASVYDSSTIDAHGTYVAGLIAANANNGGIVGVAPDIKVMPLKFISGTTGYTSDAIEAIEYAMNMGVKIINCSFGGTDNNPALMDAMSNSGILFICAAGNRGGNTTEFPIYPAAFDIDNILSVTSIDSAGVLPSFANYGENVDVAAPGTSVMSTTPGNKYDYYSGTSVSAAIVSGIAALIQSYLPEESISSIKNRIITGTTECSTLKGLITSGGRVDAYAALTGTKQVADTYTGESEVDDILPIDGEGNSDTWYIMNELASNVERFHYGEGGINPASGNYSVTCNDMSVMTPGFTMQISRSYNSRNQRQTLLGRGWTFGFEGKVTYKTDSVEISLPNGSCHVFNLEGESYVGEGTRAKFVANSSGVDILTTTDQYEYGFDITTHKMIYMEDKNGNRINLTYTSGKLVKITDTVGREYTLAYNSSSLLESVTDPAGRKVSYSYNSDNLLTQVTDPEGGTLTYAYDASQYLTTQTDQKGNVFQKIKYLHNLGTGENKVVETTDAAGETWSYSYDPASSSTTITNNDNKKWTYYFDIYMDTIKVQDPEGKSTLTEYDYKDINTYYGDVTATVDRNGNRTEYVVDNTTGNTTKVTKPDSGIKSFIYDKWNNVIEEVNEVGSRTFYIYDSEGAKLLKKALPLNGTSNYVEGDTTNFAVTSYTYYTKSEASSLFNCNVAGLLKMETDPEGNTTTYTYDQYGNIATKKDAAGNVTTYTYDSIGQKLSETTAEGNKTKWKYNDNGQVIKVTNPDGGVMRTTYDVAGHILLEVEPNLYNSTLDNTSTDVYTGTTGTAYEWYDNGYLKAVKDACGYRTVYTYDVYGNKITETKPNGAIYRYVYDSMNRLIKTYFKESSTGKEVILSEISYSTLANGNLQTTSTAYASDTQKTMTVTITDYAGREVSVQYGDYSRTQTLYNLDGTIKQKTAANGAITYCGYDALGNLTNVWKPMSVEDGVSMYSWCGYAYDRSGKVITEKTGKPLVALNATTEDVYAKYYTYENGFLTQQSDSEGRKTVYTYDGEGRAIKTIEAVTTSQNQITEYVYNYLGKPISKTTKVRSGDIYGNNYLSDDRVDVVTTYSYDLNGNLIGETDAAGNVTSYTYDKMNRNLTITKQLKIADGTLKANVTTSRNYASNGKISLERDANGINTGYYYDQYGNLATIRNAVRKGNYDTSKFYDRLGNNTAIISPKNYIAGGSLLSNPNHTEFTYDTLGRVIKQTEVYQKSEFGYLTNVRITTKAYEYDTLGNVINITDALGNVTESEYNLAGLLETTTDAETKEQGLPYTVKYTYNGLGQKVKEAYQGAVYEYTYDGAGNLLKTVVNNVIKSTASYDLLNRAISQTDGNGNTTTQSWNALGKVSQTKTPGDSTIADNKTICQYDVLGNLVYTKDSTGKVTIYTYDSLGRNLSKTISDITGNQKITTSITYDFNGNILSQTDGNGKTTTYTYNVVNKVVTATNALGQKTTYTYDANGNVTSQKDYLGNTVTKVYDGINRLVEVMNASGYTIQLLIYNDANAQTESQGGHTSIKYLYDNNLRQTGTIDGEGNTSLIAYDTRGNVSTKTDANGNTTTYKYDGENRLTCVTDALGNSTTYTYDVAGNRISETDGNGNTTTYKYNAANLVTSKIDPEGSGISGKTESYTYFANGLMATKTDRNGVTTTYTYDTFERLITEDAGGEVQSYTYDANGNLLTMTDASGTTTRTYDALNRNISKTVPDIGTSTYEYDLTAAVEGGYSERTTDAKGNITTNTYDKVGRLSSVTVGEETTDYYYGIDNNNLECIHYPDGTSEMYGYNGDNRVTYLDNIKSDGTVISSYKYTYDKAGNQLTKVEEKGTTTYTYDNLSRLSSVTEPTGKITSYTYDGAGNRKTETLQQGSLGSNTVYNYNSQNRLASTISTGGVYAKYIYDNNGNLISKTSGTTQSVSGGALTVEELPDFGLIIKHGTDNGTGTEDLTLYDYDNYNRLTSFKAEDTTAAYEYNAQGYRVEKTVNCATTRYLYNADKVVLETDSSGNQTAFMAYGNALLYRTVAETSDTAAQSYYYLYNAHGDVTALIDAAGTIAATYDYDAFGNMLNETGDANNYIKYAGYQSDDESGLYYLNARYYDSVTARFITEDTYTGQENDPLSLNLYTYCSNNPIIYFDPTGHWKAGDEDLNDDAKAQIIALSSAYRFAQTPEEKKEIKQQAESIRANATSWEDKDTLIEINNVSFYDVYMTGAMEDGKLSKIEYETSLKLIEATVSTSSSPANLSNNLTSTTNTLLTIGKADISVNTSVSYGKSTNLVTASINLDVTTHYSAYIFYIPGWENSYTMEEGRKSLASYYGIDEDDIGTASIANAGELSDAWNSIGYTVDGNNVSAVVIDTHADHSCLDFDLSVVGDEMPTNEISNLEDKNINNLVLYGCNAGHLDYSECNPAAVFSQIINGGKVLASDGTVYNAGLEYFQSFGDRAFSSNGDPTFKRELSDGARKNKGWIIYQYIDNIVTTSEGIGKKLTLKQMLKKMK